MAVIHFGDASLSCPVHVLTTCCSLECQTRFVLEVFYVETGWSLTMIDIQVNRFIFCQLINMLIFVCCFQL